MTLRSSKSRSSGQHHVVTLRSEKEGKDMEIVVNIDGKHHGIGEQ